MSRENMPGKIQRDPEELTKLEAEREQADKQFQAQADARNKNRSLGKKILGKGKETAVDLAQEEALRRNKLADEKDAREKREGEKFIAQTSWDEVGQSAEFGAKGEEEIKIMELIRAKCPDVIKRIQGGRIPSSWYEMEKLGIKNKKNREIFERVFNKMVSNQVDTLIKSNDVEGIRELISRNSLDDIGVENMARIPKEIIYLPEIQTALLHKIEVDFTYNYDLHPEQAKELADKLVELKLIKPEAVQELFTSSKMQDLMLQKIKVNFTYGYDLHPEQAVELADKLVGLNIIRKETVQAFFDSPQMQRLMIDQIERTFYHGYVLYPEEAIKLANKLVKLGIIKQETVQEIFASPKIQESIQKRIRMDVGYDKKLDKAKETADKYVKLGLMKQNDADQFLTKLG